MTIETSTLEAIESRTQTSNWLGWAAFLAASWTWCIGMFLPFLLVRDFGIWAWFVFAIPNVVGAAAMGWMLRTPQLSARIATDHHQACTLFSGVTIAFQFYFVESVIAPLAHNADLAIGGVVTLVILMYLLMSRQLNAAIILAIVALVISLVAMMLSFGEMHLLYNGAVEHSPSIIRPFSANLLFLTPICVFGFALCPYLDLTFHRARQQSGNAKASFGVGFGILFLAMIVFTLIYTPALIANWLTPLLSVALCIHMGVQCSFTIAAHARELRHGAGRAIIVAVVLIIGSWMAYWFVQRTWGPHGPKTGEMIYRIFMGFYGLVFPAYVWLVMLPRRGSRSMPTRRNVSVFILATLAALPMFWLGFVMSRMIWLVPGLAIVLLARLAGGKSNQQNSAPI